MRVRLDVKIAGRGTGMPRMIRRLIRRAPVSSGPSREFAPARRCQARNKNDDRQYYRGQSTSYVPSLSTITAATSRCFPLTTA